MKIEFLGDAYDHWKGSLIQILNDSEAIQNLAVEPMITDGNWGAEDFQTYKRLLHLRLQSDILNQNPTFGQWRKERKIYFEKAQHQKGDMFIDPDIGIKSPNSKPNKKHITFEEIENLLDEHRVLMIYQHSNRTHDWIKDKKEMILESITGVQCYPHKGRQVAMFFISWDTGRIEKIKKTLRPYTFDKKEI